MYIEDLGRQRSVSSFLIERLLFNSDAGTYYCPPKVWTCGVPRLRCFVGISLISQRDGWHKIANQEF